MVTRKDTADRRQARRAVLEAEVQELMARAQAKLREIEGLDVDARRNTTEASGGVQRRPLRALILDALEEIGSPTYTRELILFLRARYGREVPPTRFGSLSSDERNAFERGGPRPVWLCHGITWDRGEAIKRLWARSDWPLERRLVAPTTGRVQHLLLTRRLSEMAQQEADTAADPDMMRILAADHARDLPGIIFRRGEFPLEEWRSVADRILAEVLPRDEESRREAARRLTALTPAHQLFGVPDIPELRVAEPAG